MSRPRPWVIVPGIWNSDAEHWQSVWQRERGDDAVRIAPASWGEPDPGDWRDAISRAVASCAEPPVLVAHSLGVLAVADWLAADAAAAAAVASAEGPTVAGAFLVAPPDPAAPGFPAAASGFPAPRPIPAGTAAARVPTRMVVSDDDPYCTADRALAFAETMGAAALRVGPLGHVNVASGVGAWPAGRELLGAFEQTL
ncbi:alpha/beta hydrolase [Curtobacterium flaccumfaciens pv. oortii]|uniref:RBBP9/YdeN family alpha/beta hydrolase n=1 Tax=Curtobacterium flaccumfaciens TaxID=2035 RepID=UPI001BDDFC38|nr:alpha/beta hydrolase [Curtobacterium flaccumfaciens]MBT1622744.1 alpha/beta hydrolase [Curtobacterium flaccumfaciens pv. oortii]